MNRSSSNRFGAFLKWGLTAVLCLVLSGMVYRDFKGLMRDWGHYFSWEKIMIHPERVKAKAAAKAINQVMPVSFDGLVALAKAKTPQDMAEGALKRYSDYYKSIVRLIPENVQAYEFLAFCLYYLNDEPGAVRLYKDALNIYPNSFWSLFNLGSLYFKDKQYAKAAFYLRRAAVMSPEHTIQDMLASKVYLQLIVNKALGPDDIQTGLRESYQTCFMLLALAYYYLDDFSNMLKVSQDAIRLSLDKKDFFYYATGVSLYHLGKYPEAFQALKQCLQRNSEFTEGFFYAGKTLEKIGQEKTASFYYEKARMLADERGSMLPSLEDIHPKIF